MDFNTLKKIISDNHKFLITTHVNPDADAIGSEIAMYQILKKLGKQSWIINHSSLPYNLQFLDSEKVIEKFDAAKHSKIFQDVDLLIALDFNRSDRMVSMQKSFLESAKKKVCIDHHQDPENFVDYSFIDISYSATCEIIYDFLMHTKIAEMGKEIALPLYAGIMTDTGSFRFERTTADLHRKIADLLDYDVNPALVYDSLYDQSKFSKIKLLGKALDSIRILANNKMAYMVLTQNDFKETGALESDTENFVNFNLSIEEVELGLLFIELKNGFKVSFRSKGNIPVNKLAEEFGGGGHFNAAGVRFFNKQIKDLIDPILEKGKLYLNQAGK